MAGLTGDTHVFRYGSGDDCQPTAYGVGASQQLYYGEVALLSTGGSTTAGYLRNAATANSGDIIVGMIGDPGGGTLVKTGPGILGGTTDGSVWVDVLTGAFFFQSGTGADQLSAATNGKTVYYGGENSSGPIAMATIGNGSRPVLGVQVAQDPGIAGGFTPGASWWPVTVVPLIGRP
jgi:hypothetical protein